MARGRVVVDGQYLPLAPLDAEDIATGAIEEIKLEAVILHRLLPVARVESTNVSYCKVG